MNIFKRLFAGKNSPPDESKDNSGQAVFIHLDGQTLPDDVYENFDLATLEDQLEDLLTENNLGIWDGHESGPGGTTIFLYGPDSERIFTTIEETLRSYPLCQNARIEIRLGGIGAKAREITLLQNQSL